ncbi:MAG TPA: DUF3243 domain-containing protein [Pseudogracilibacillus sp.]|nr:DUF3243 domain-containing protein [Pseudogracilibacillus sp.]
MSVLDDFSTWKQFLANKVEQAESHGMSDQAMTSFAQHIGDYLSKHVEPENKEERMLQQLWSVASKDEKEALANAMIKLVKK